MKINLVRKVSAALVSSALLASILAPTAYADLEISDNGANSTNSINVSSSNDTTVEQVNETLVGAYVGAQASTGGNSASGNTGGDVQITTGDASATATVLVTGGSNLAAVNPCGCPCPEENGSAIISGNGAGSKNRIRKTKTNSLSVGQATATLVEAKVKAKAKTGKNRASWNTGGSTSIDTGSTSSSADLAVHGGSNVLNGCGCNGEILPVE